MDIKKDIYTIITDTQVVGENIIEMSAMCPLIPKDELQTTLKIRGTPLDKYKYFSTPKIYMRYIGNDSKEIVCTLSKVEILYNMLNSTWNITCQGSNKEKIDLIIDKITDYTFPTIIYTIITELKNQLSITLLTIRLFRDEDTGEVNTILIRYNDNKILIVRN